MNIHTAIETIQIRLPDDPEDAAIQALGKLEQEIDTLRQQLAEAKAGRWQPVKDGQWSQEIITKQNELGEVQLIIEGGQIIHIQAPDEGVSFELEDNIRLCQRVEVESTKASDK